MSLHIVAIGAHPDDAEAGCGGTLARYAAAGHQVSIIYLTRGERGIPDMDMDMAASIRTAEAQDACRILGARAIFAGQLDGETECTPARIDELQRLLHAEHADVLFTHWPVDTHLDHQITSVLATRAAQAFLIPLYFFEVNRLVQTRAFEPVILVDIATTLDKKRAALFSHRSQEGETRIYKVQTEPTERLRGRGLGVRAAEAYIPFLDAPAELPGLSHTLPYPKNVV